MEEIMKSFRSKGAAVALVLGLLGLSFEAAFAQSSDFFSNTQTLEQRATPTTAPNAPGFNPCWGGGAGMTSSNCDSSAALLSPANVQTNFVISGPGAITDNMFGRVSGAALGANGTASSSDTGFNVDTPITKCAPGFGAAGFDTSADGGLNGLNCGDVRLDPTTQGISIPSGANTLGTGSAMTATSPMNMTSGTT